MPISSSSAVIAGFWTITLKIGTDRSGNTSRGSSRSHAKPSAAASSTRPTPRIGRAKNPRMMRKIAPLPSVVMVAALAACLFRFGLQEERAFHHDGFPGAKPGKNLDLPSEVAPPSDPANLELPFFMAGQEHAPAVVHPLQSGGGPGDDRLGGRVDRQ